MLRTVLGVGLLTSTTYWPVFESGALDGKGGAGRAGDWLLVLVPLITQRGGTGGGDAQRDGLTFGDLLACRRLSDGNLSVEDGENRGAGSDRRGGVRVGMRTEYAPAASASTVSRANVALVAPSTGEPSFNH